MACANNAGLNSVVAKFAEFRLAAAAAALLELNVGGFPSMEISLVRHFEPFLKRRKLLPLFLKCEPREIFWFYYLVFEFNYEINSTFDSFETK